MWPFGTYTESPDFKKNPNVVYAINISKITNFSERLKDRTLRKYNFVNLFNVETDIKVLQGTTYVWKIQTIQREFVLHAFNPMMNCRTNFLNTLYVWNRLLMFRNADWILKGPCAIFFLKQNSQMIKLEKYYAHAS